MADQVRPVDWPGWYPIRCPAGHPLVAGRIAKHWVNHACPASEGGDSRGHHVISCETGLCGAFMAPSGCPGP